MKIYENKKGNKMPFFNSVPLFTVVSRLVYILYKPMLAYTIKLAYIIIDHSFTKYLKGVHSAVIEKICLNLLGSYGHK